MRKPGEEINTASRLPKNEERDTKVVYRIRSGPITKFTSIVGQISRFRAMHMTVTLLILGCLSTGCGEIDDGDFAQQSMDTDTVDTLASSLRARTSKRCDCPPQVRVFYTTAEPACDWVCGEIETEKLVHTEEAFPSRREQDMPASDVDCEDCNPTIRREWSSANDQDLAEENDAEDRPEHECYTVCPDWTVIGPHRCDIVPICPTEKTKYIDVSAGGSSTLDTR